MSLNISIYLTLYLLIKFLNSPLVFHWWGGINWCVEIGRGIDNQLVCWRLFGSGGRGRGMNRQSTNQLLPLGHQWRECWVRFLLEGGNVAGGGTITMVRAAR
jgi:hypothetical protein